MKEQKKKTAKIPARGRPNFYFMHTFVYNSCIKKSILLKIKLITMS